jgi:hypothetical protein
MRPSGRLKPAAGGISFREPHRDEQVLHVGIFRLPVLEGIRAASSTSRPDITAAFF